MDSRTAPPQSYTQACGPEASSTSWPRLASKTDTLFPASSAELYDPQCLPSLQGKQIKKLPALPLRTENSELITLPTCTATHNTTHFRLRSPCQSYILSLSERGSTSLYERRKLRHREGERSPQAQLMEP